MHPNDMKKVMEFLRKDSIVKVRLTCRTGVSYSVLSCSLQRSYHTAYAALQAIHDAKSEEIGPGIYRFKAELGKNATSESWRFAFNNRCSRQGT